MYDKLLKPRQSFGITLYNSHIPYQIHILFYLPSPLISFPSLAGSRVFVLRTALLQVKILEDFVRTYRIVSRVRSLWRVRARHLISFHWLSCWLFEPIFPFSKWTGDLIFTSYLLLIHMRKILISSPDTVYPARGRWPQSLDIKTDVVTKQLTPRGEILRKKLTDPQLV